MTLRVAVVGAGIVGVSCALELLRDGCEVTLLEAGEPGGQQATSFGNGAWLSPASVVPMSMPGLWKKLPGYLLDPQGPLTIRWGALAALTPWLLRFVQAGNTVEKVQRTAKALSALLCDAPQRHQALAQEAGVPELIQQRGLLYAYPDKAAFLAEALSWQLRRENGVEWTELDSAELHRQVPQLHARYGFGARVDAGAHCLDPGAYVAALASHAVAQGAQLRRCRATGLDLAGGRLRAVLTDAGPVACDRLVIAGGIASKTLARAAGDVVYMESERGYHVSIKNPGFSLSLPVMPSDGKMANTSTLAGLRVAGQVELCSTEAPADWRRADILLKHALSTYPELGVSIEPARQTRWLGHRPSSADGLPIIGPASGCPDVFHAFGHGHVGLASGPISGRLVADLIAGSTPVVDPRPYSASRSGRLAVRRA